MRRAAEAVRDHTPLQFKFEFGLWTPSLIASPRYHSCIIIDTGVHALQSRTAPSIGSHQSFLHWSGLQVSKPGAHG